jgi:hypothetical protein
MSPLDGMAVAGENLDGDTPGRDLSGGHFGRTTGGQSPSRVGSSDDIGAQHEHKTA